MAILVAQAESGQPHTIDHLEPTDSVAVLRDALAQRYNIAAEAQILLLDGQKMEDQHVLAEYSLPHHPPHARTVFLFDRRTFSRAAKPPEPPLLTPDELSVPDELDASALTARTLDAASPLVLALVEYERNFKLHAVQANTIHAGGVARLDAARAAIKRSELQVGALEAAISNLRRFALALSERYSTFHRKFTEQMGTQAELAASFEADLESLRSHAVDESLCDFEGLPAGATLLDCCGEERLRAWLDDCQRYADTLSAKAAQYALAWSELQGSLAEEELPSDTPPMAVRLRLEAAERLLQQQASLVAELEYDAGHASKMVDLHAGGVGGAASSSAAEVAPGSPPPQSPPARAASEGAAAAAVSSQKAGESSSKLIDECASLDSTHRRHRQVLLPQMRSLDQGLRGAQEDAHKAKHALTLLIFKRLRAISVLTSQIAELRNKLHLYGSLLERVAQFCDQLMLTRRLPQTYEQCIGEIARRREFNEAFDSITQSAAESLASAREEEVARRDAFMREAGSKLPRNLSSLTALLLAHPMNIEVNMLEVDGDASTVINRIGDSLAASKKLHSVSVPAAAAADASDGGGSGVVIDEALRPRVISDAIPPDEVLRIEASIQEAVPEAAPEAEPGDASPAPDDDGAVLPKATLSDAAPSAASHETASPAAMATEGSIHAIPVGKHPPAGGDDAPPLASATAAPGDAATPPSTTPEVAAVVRSQEPPLRVLSDPPPTRNTVPLGRSASDHTGLHDMLRYGNDGGERLGCTAAAAGSRDSWAARAALLVGGQRPGLAKAAVLASQCTGELTALDAALEALGTPMEGIPVEVASQLQQRIASKERDADQERERRAGLEMALARERSVTEELRAQLQSLEERLAKSQLPPTVSTDASTSATLHEMDAAAGATSTVAAKVDATAADGRMAVLATEISSLERALEGTSRAKAELLDGVRSALSCLPPPTSRSRSSDAAASNLPSASAEATTPAGAAVEAARDIAIQLSSSAREAARANARLGHVMATEREARSAADARLASRLSYLDLEPNARVLFVAQPERFAAHGSTAFAALVAPSGSLPTHWLSEESIESLRRWCDEEKVHLADLRFVVGSVVQVTGPLTVGDNSASENPYHLPFGASYHIVHAEMILEHSWLGGGHA